MQNIGAMAICIGWSAIYAIVAFLLVEFVLWLLSLFGWGTYPVPLTAPPSGAALMRIIPLIYFIILLIGCLMGHAPNASPSGG